MKKITSLFILVVAILLFIWLKYYGESSSYNYHLAYFAEYVLYWSVDIFILSLFAFAINNTKYKRWLIVTIPLMLISIAFAYSIDGNDVLFDGQYVTFWLIGLYSFFSIIYFIVQFFKKDKQEKPEKNYFTN